MKGFMFLILLVVGLLVHSSNAGSLLSFKVESRSRECLYEEIKQDNEGVELQYEVIEGGDLDIGITVKKTGNDQKIIHKLANFDVRRGGSNDPEKLNLVKLARGTYEICFDNIMASKDYKIVVVYQENEKQERNKVAEEEKLVEKSEMDYLNDLSKQLESELTRLEKLQRYFQRRLHRHIWTQESTDARANWMTMVEVFIVVTIVLAQTVYIKHWFKTAQKSFRV